MNNQAHHHPITWLYVLHLKDDHYYVGTTKDLSRRFDEHWSGEGSAFTHKYPPIEVIGIFRDKQPLDEDSKVKELMLIHGIDKVRGGSYSQCQLNEEQLSTLNREFTHAKGGCFGCQSPDHWIKDCPKKNTSAPVKQTKHSLEIKENHQNSISTHGENCSRCGRNTHSADKCYAKTHISGQSIEKTIHLTIPKENFFEKRIEYYNNSNSLDNISQQPISTVIIPNQPQTDSNYCIIQ